jgi:hypothetical protein
VATWCATTTCTSAAAPACTHPSTSQSRCVEGCVLCSRSALGYLTAFACHPPLAA